MRNKTSSNKTIIIILFVILFLIVAAIVVIVFYLRGNGEKEINKQIGEIYYQATSDEHIASEDSGIMYADNELLVVIKEGVTKTEVESLAEKYNAKIVGCIEATGDYQWSLNAVYTMSKLKDLANTIANEESVIQVSPNFFYNLSENSVDNDINTGKKWKNDLKNSNDNKGKSWGVEAINAPEAWKIMNDRRNQIQPVRVGVIDNGFDESHSDLPFEEVFYNKPYMDASDKDKKELGGHGTHVTGTFAANGTNSDGICGVYPYSEEGKLYAASWENGNRQYGENKQSLISQEVCFAELVLRNVKVINCSYGSADYYGATAMYYINVLNDREKADSLYGELVNAGSYFGAFLNRFLEKGYDFIIVKSAGNSSNKTVKIKINGQEIDYQTGDVPAIYNGFLETISASEYQNVYSRIIVVGAIDKEYNRAYFSNNGTFSEKTERVDVYAPGWDIYSTVPVNKYENGEKWSGTSMAAPHVAGVAASVWSINNGFTGTVVKKIICQALNTDHSDLPIIDMASAIQIALSTGQNATLDPEQPNADNGAVMGFVVDKDNYSVTGDGIETGAITDAEIKAVNNDNYQMTLVKTDSAGHFELVLPPGQYTLTVNATGYEPYTWPETINVEGGQVHYLNDWIKLTLHDISQIVGTYKGQYTAAQGDTGLTLSIYKTSDVVKSQTIQQRLVDIATECSNNSEGIPQKEYNSEEIKSIVQQHSGEYIAFFYYYPLSSNPDVEDGLYTMSVDYDPSTGYFSLIGETWIQRETYVFADFNNVYVENGEMFGTWDLDVVKQ